MKRKRLVVVTTVPETLRTILHGQPRYLSQYFDLILVSSGGVELAAIGRDESVPVRAVPMVRGISIFRDLLSVLHMLWVLLILRPDVVHSYTPKAGLVTMLASFLCRVPVRVHTFTGLIFPTATGARQKLLIWVDRLICACATHIVPEGEGVKRDLVFFGVTSKPLRVIGHGNIAGVNVDYFSITHDGVSEAAVSLRQARGISADDFVFCFVGRLNRDKGVAELIAAFKAQNAKAHLLLVGGVDETAPVAAHVLAELQSHPRIHHLGFMRDIRPALSASALLVLPSYREGFPNVILQAGAMQLPVIATDISGCNEVIDPGENGWLVAVKNISVLQQAMQQAMQLPASELCKMGRFARQRVEQRFEQSAHWERMKAFYQSVLVDNVGRCNDQKIG